MAIIDGTRDALECLRDRVQRGGGRFDVARVGRRGCADDGGKTGRLVQLNEDGVPLRDNEGKEIAVQWCHTCGPLPTFVDLD